MALPPMLEDLDIANCRILESLPEGTKQINTTLGNSNIFECDSRMSLSRGINLLKNLSIKWCEKLELKLGEDMKHNHYASLTSLSLNGCSSLVSFPLAFFTKLEYLCIRKCIKLECLYIPDGLHHVDHLTSLQSLRIRDCPNLVSFPQGGLPTPNLTSLDISWCNKLKSLPQGMHTLLTSLQELNIYYCPEIDSFPEGGLPTTLSQLRISYCNKLVTNRMEWGLQTLPFLRILEIGGHNEEQRLELWFLPSTLNLLGIVDLPNLKCLDDKGLQHLTSLETLRINGCEKLEYLPKQGLPSSLSRLYITSCPLLRKRCQRDKGKEWPKISHIPCVVFEERHKLDKEVILS